jgi:hypothetical protein
MSSKTEVNDDAVDPLLRRRRNLQGSDYRSDQGGADAEARGPFDQDPQRSATDEDDPELPGDQD